MTGITDLIAAIHGSAGAPCDAFVAHPADASTGDPHRQAFDANSTRGTGANA